MARIKRGTVSRRKHNKLLKSTKGFRMSRRRLVKSAKEASLHAGVYAYAGRRKKKRDFRRLWITRISQGIRAFDLNYSTFMKKLKDKNVVVNRKMLSDLIVNDPSAFKALVEKVK